MSRAGRQAGQGFPKTPSKTWLEFPRLIHPSFHPYIHPPREEGKSTYEPAARNPNPNIRSLARSLSVPPSLLEIAIRAHHKPRESSSPDTTQQSGHRQAPDRQTETGGRKKECVRREKSVQEGGGGKGAIIMATANSNLPRRIIKVRITKNVCFLYLGLISPLVVIEQPWNCGLVALIPTQLTFRRFRSRFASDLNCPGMQWLMRVFCKLEWNVY